MKALISGQASTAVFFGPDSIYMIHLDEPEIREPIQDWYVRDLFADTTDIEQIDSDEPTILKRLELATEMDRGLQLVLIMLDNEEDRDLRLSAASCLDELLAIPDVKEFIQNRVYVAPLPPSADLPQATIICSEFGLERVNELITALQDDQEEIERRSEAWANLPPSLFGDLEGKKAFYFDAVRLGAFRMFASERGRKNWALIQLLNDPYFRGNPTARVVFKEWASKFQESATAAKFEQRPERERRDKAQVPKKRTVKPHQAFEQAEKQREAIKELFTEGKQELALRFTEQLIANQRRTSEPEHIAKSLCDLAQFVKRLGSPELQLELAKMAIGEAPNDPWSYATIADAYRTLADYRNAQDAYHNAGVFGDVRIAMIGRAEILKDIGQLADALEIFNQCVKDFPNDVISRNARASALADFGKFDEALEEYNRILEIWPDEQVTLSGRAQVLRHLGRLEEALKEFDCVVTLYPDASISHHSRGETLRDLGRITEARDTFAFLMQRFPLAAEMQLSFAKTLRDLGHFDDAIEQYLDVTMRHPLNVSGHVGLADTYRKTGDLVNAIKSYDAVITSGVHTSFARNGKASIMVIQGAYQDAFKLLPTTLPATLPEWVSYHIRSMAYMHSGKLERAERDFSWGVQENPWVLQRQYFHTALAALRIRQRRYRESIELAERVTHVSVQPIARVLTMHAYGELGSLQQVATMFDSVPETSAPSVIYLRNVLASRYLSNAQGSSATSEDRVFLQECDSLLLAA